MGRLNLIAKLAERARNWLRPPGHEEQLRTGLERAARVENLSSAEQAEGGFKPFSRLGKLSIQEEQDDLSKQLLGDDDILGAIRVTAFVGPSGTGKSTRALKIARTEEIFDIIDDGILICGSRIVAGATAKRAGSKIESVRQAIFAEPVRAEIMKRALIKRAPKDLLVLGTSTDMVERICNNLSLNKPEKYIMIEDVTTEAERNLAKSVRISEGKHTIPVPSLEIKHEFSGYLSDPILRLKRRLDRGGKDAQAIRREERSVVRPTFSALGTYSISDQAMAQLLDIELRTIPGVNKLLDLQLDKEPYGLFLYIDLAILYGYNAQEVLKNAQQAAAICLERYTAVNILATNVRALKLVKLEKLDRQI
ncbi:MAG: ATP-binding protein [Eubacteriales bacterium]|nr:ATP-binding protein [Eubacteriales bacterium]